MVKKILGISVLFLTTARGSTMMSKKAHEKTAIGGLHKNNAIILSQRKTIGFRLITTLNNISVTFKQPKSRLNAKFFTYIC